MTTPLLVGILAAFFAVTLAAGLGRAPTWARCPSCRASTKSVELPSWLRGAAPGLRVRWCPTCGWEGVGREGAEVAPGHPVAHGSGFRWGEDRLPEDFGFRFAGAETPVSPVPEESPPPPPAHPSGFRFASDPEPTSDSDREGFAWRTGNDASRPDVEVRPGFQWRERPPEGAPVFRWRG